MQLSHILLEKDVTFAPLALGDPRMIRWLLGSFLHSSTYFSSIFVPASEVLNCVHVQFYADDVL